MSARSTLVYRRTPELKLTADVYPGQGAGRRPALLWLHGGGLIFGDRANLAADQARLYTDAGYTVVAVDYRLAPETKLPEICSDVLAAWDWLVTEAPRSLPIDPDRLAVTGHSAGAYLALLLAARAEPGPRAVVSFYGYGDIVGRWYTRPDRHYRAMPAVAETEARRVVGGMPIATGGFEPRFRFYVYCRQQGTWPIEVSGHDPKQESAWFRSYCPINAVTPSFPPTLFVHGEADTDVPCERSRDMAQALETAGARSELVTVSGRGHGFDRRDGGLADPVNAQIFRQVVKFLGECLGTA